MNSKRGNLFVKKNCWIYKHYGQQNYVGSIWTCMYHARWCYFLANADIVSRLNQLEQQILVHSIMYYRLGASIWNDKQYDKTAKELKRLIVECPAEFRESILYEEFKGFEWGSGYDLPLYHEGYTAKALWLMEYHKEQGGLL